MGEIIVTWIQTYTGRKVFPLDLTPDQICIEDIAHSLAGINRYLAHTRSYISVAQHSVLVSLSVPVEDALWGLLHDAHEAYLGDIVRPLKGVLMVHNQTLLSFSALERMASESVAQRFGLPWPPPDSVQHNDDVLMATEVRDLMGQPVDNWTDHLPDPLSRTIRAWDPMESKTMFLRRFEELKI